MTARSKKQRVRNKRIKREVNKVRELKRLQVTVLGKNAKELMEVCSEVVDVKSHEELKKVRYIETDRILINILTKILPIIF